MTRRIKREGIGGTADLRGTKMVSDTVASLKLKAVRPGHLVYLLDGASGRPLAVGGPTAWLYADGTAV